MALKNSPKAALLTTIRHRNNGHCKAQKCTFYSSWWEPLTYRPDSGERVGGQQNWPATWGPVGSCGARARRAPGQRPFLGAPHLEPPQSLPEPLGPGAARHPAPRGPSGTRVRGAAAGCSCRRRLAAAATHPGTRC